MIAYPLSAADVSQSVRGVLVEYLPAQLAASPRPLPAPTSYDQVPTAEAMRKVYGSSLAVVVPGLRGDPERRADNTYELDWVVSVAVWHQHTPAMPLLSAAADYAAAVRQVLLDHTPSVATQVDYGGESVDLVGDGLTDAVMGLATVEFTVRTGSQLLFTPTPDVSGPVVLTTDIALNPNP